MFLRPARLLRAFPTSFVLFALQDLFEDLDMLLAERIDVQASDFPDILQLGVVADVAEKDLLGVLRTRQRSRTPVQRRH